MLRGITADAACKEDMGFHPGLVRYPPCKANGKRSRWFPPLFTFREITTVRGHWRGRLERFLGQLFRFAQPSPTPKACGEQVDEKSGQAESWFRITERNGVYEGAIVKISYGENIGPGSDFCFGARIPCYIP